MNQQHQPRTTLTLLEVLRKQGKQVGDTVHIRNKPHYIYDIRPDSMTFVSMDERRVYTTITDSKHAQK
jgi:hypothetical protein